MVRGCNVLPVFHFTNTEKLTAQESRHKYLLGFLRGDSRESKVFCFRAIMLTYKYLEAHEVEEVYKLR